MIKFRDFANGDLEALFDVISIALCWHLCNFGKEATVTINLFI